jgi:pimeloyl-ACP methyl ester carboxylesterase
MRAIHAPGSMAAPALERFMHSHYPFVRQSGHGEAVVCLHASTSSSRQWGALIERLEPACHVLAPDLAGHGGTAWQDRGANALEEDLRLVEAVAGGEAVHLVGHSYGGAVALRYAMRHPQRVRSLVLYEPAMWHLVAVGAAGDRAALKVFDVGHRVMGLVAAGSYLDAARLFLDDWNGAGSWERMNAAQRDRIAAQMVRVVAHFAALFLDRTPLVAYAALGMPALVMSGGAGPRSGQRAAELLAATLPRALPRRFPALGHMGPMISPDEVNAAIAAFFAEAGVSEQTAPVPASRIMAPWRRAPAADYALTCAT